MDDPAREADADDVGRRRAHPRRPRRDARPRPPRRIDAHRRGPLPGPGRLAADGDRSTPGGARRRAAGRARVRRRSCRFPRDRRSRSSTPRSAARPRPPTPSTRRCGRAAGTSRGDPTTASRRSARANGRASIATRSGALRSRARGLAADAARWPGRRAASHSPRSRHGSGRRSRRILATLGRRAGRPARSTARRSRATASRAAVHPWSVVVGHDGVFKIALLTLFGLALERFWMWSMDLCAITVVEFRAGRPVLRAHNLTAHLAALDATARRPRTRHRRAARCGA